MGIQKFFILKTHFDLVNKGILYEFMYEKMFQFAGSFWVLVCNSLSHLFGFVFGYFFRFLVDEKSGKNDTNCNVAISHQDDQTGSDCVEVSEFDGFDEKEKSQLSFRFRLLSNKGSTEDSVCTENVSSASTSKYQFTYGKDFSGFMEEPETMSFAVQELYVSSIDACIGNSRILDTASFADKDFLKLNLQAEAINQEKTEDSADEDSQKFELEAEVINQAEADDFAGEEFQELKPETEAVNQEIAEDSSNNDFQESELDTEALEQAKPEDSADKDLQDFKLEKESISQEKAANFAEISHGEEVPEKAELVTVAECKLSDEGEVVGLQNNVQGEPDFPDDVQSLSANFLSTRKSDGFSISSHQIDSINCKIFSDGDGGEKFEAGSLKTTNASILDPEAAVIRDKPRDADDEYIELELHSQNLNVLHEENFSVKDFSEVEDNHEHEDLESKETEPIDEFEKSEKPSLPEKSWPVDSDDQIGLEFLWEHKDLIEQLKLELRKVKTGGLPTILEESESPKIVDDLKPLKIDEKFEHKDRMEEIQKFYKSYAEKMRKLDILNYQTLHAIGFLQLKDQVCRKPSVPTIKSLLSQSFRQYKLQRSDTDPTQKFITELHRDLEMVYVGQVCLSWEILHWQYRKAQELQEYDSYGFRHYNQVADEFQQFQVLVQRFIENEPFQGPRVQNYVKNRCVLSCLLQVPAIKDDCLKDNKGTGERGEDAISISSAMLTEPTEESMQVFWEFLRADKDETNAILKSLQGTRVELQDPADSELFMEVRTKLQKKERKLKDLLRSGNCIVKKFQKHQEHRLDHAEFIAQIEMRLVSRVLNMSRLTTNQLVWCHKKLSKISFVNRNIHMEPSFLLFPC